MSGTSQGTGRFEVRVQTPAPHGPGTRSIYTRTSRVQLGLAALSQIARQWANTDGSVAPGTTVDLIDTTDGGPVAQLKFLGFATGTLDDALNALQANGFGEITSVPQPGQWLAGQQSRR